MKLNRFAFTILAFVMMGLFGCIEKKPTFNIPHSPPPMVLIKKPQVVLVLGGGGARGYAHLGVLQALQEAHIPIDAITCASSGCIVGSLFADNQNAIKTSQIMGQAGFWTFADVSNFPHLNGFISGYHLENFLLANMRARHFNQLQIPLVVATTDFKNGYGFPIAGGPIAPAILASTALPGIVKPQLLYSHELMDGGLADPVPVDLAMKWHPKIIIAVDIAQELPTQIPRTSLHIYSRANDIIWSSFSRNSMRGANIIIEPKVGTVGTFDLSHKKKLIEAGYDATERMIPEIKKLLHDNPTN